jgi:KTSC domain
MAVKSHNFESSTAILGIRWDEDSKELTVIFRNGRYYAFQDVPEDVFDRFSSASSAGRFFAQEIKERYA